MLRICSVGSPKEMFTAIDYIWVMCVHILLLGWWCSARSGHAKTPNTSTTHSVSEPTAETTDRPRPRRRSDCDGRLASKAGT